MPDKIQQAENSLELQTAELVIDDMFRNNLRLKSLIAHGHIDGEDADTLILRIHNSLLLLKDLVRDAHLKKKSQVIEHRGEGEEGK